MMGADEFDEQLAPPPAAVVPAEFTWKGQPLARYSFARKIVFQNLRQKGEDPEAEFYTLALLFILLGTKEQCEKWILNAGSARAGALAFIEDFPPGDYQAAVDMMSTILDRAKNLVKPEGGGAALQKKTSSP